MPKVDYSLVNGFGESKLWRPQLKLAIRTLSYEKQFTFGELLLVNSEMKLLCQLNTKLRQTLFQLRDIMAHDIYVIVKKRAKL